MIFRDSIFLAVRQIWLSYLAYFLRALGVPFFQVLQVTHTHRYLDTRFWLSLTAPPFFALCIRCVSEEFVSLRSVVLSLALDDFFRRRKLSVCVSFAMSPSSDRS